MNTTEIKKALLNGYTFGNEVAGWSAICRHSEKLYWVTIGEENLFYNNIDSMAKRVLKLINTGC